MTAAGINFSCLNFCPADVNALHTFVNVALHTSAGEGAYRSDKLSYLQMVGSGYAPLIYELKENSDFSTFQKKCEALWEAISSNPKLLTCLVTK